MKRMIAAFVIGLGVTLFSASPALAKCFSYTILNSDGTMTV